jgi:hypothetical protein
VIDDVSLSFESQVRARTALHRFVDQRIGAGDLVQILRTGGGIGNLHLEPGAYTLAVSGARAEAPPDRAPRAGWCRDRSPQRTRLDQRGGRIRTDSNGE